MMFLIVLFVIHINKNSYILHLAVFNTQKNAEIKKCIALVAGFASG